MNIRSAFMMYECRNCEEKLKNMKIISLTIHPE